MEHYEKELEFLNAEFWTKLGYPKDIRMAPDLPSDDEKVRKYRFQKCPPCIQCDRCFQFRELIFNSQLLDPTFPPDSWECEQNWDTNFQRYFELEKSFSSRNLFYYLCYFTSCNTLASLKDIKEIKYVKPAADWAEVNKQQEERRQPSSSSQIR